MKSYPGYDMIGKAISRSQFRNVCDKNGEIDSDKVKELAKDYAEIIFVDPFWENGAIQLLCTALEILFTKNPDATREDFFELFSKDENAFIDYIMEGKVTDFKALLFATNPLIAITSIYYAIRTAFTSATIEEAEKFS